ncbi:MAG: hypothetical protein RBG1_1C00001G0573 [candidate division Zixibacteria bacterium RBG-1]|nr:MAG: hypothetical protein RBG1_1C00001G0573 [candidate division Zixibacteria bacterium RBG-1]OGC83270.1 MAG: hypothetical protein A2V73_05500 [candidate division Zixibacteria bacterium RBG_19FT_COMBO_42_43]
MKIKFSLSLKNIVVDETYIDHLIFDWEEEATPEEVLRMSEKWITTRNFLTTRMSGLKKVGESSFTIEPVEE